MLTLTPIYARPSQHGYQHGATPAGRAAPGVRWRACPRGVVEAADRSGLADNPGGEPHPKSTPAVLA